MAKVYFFNGGSHGHVYPTLGLVAELVRRGDEIIYYCTDDFRAHIERAGATYRPYPVPEPDQPIMGLIDLATYFLRYSAALLPHLVEIARVEHPDYIIFDMFRVWGWQLGKILNIPAICCDPSFGDSVVMLRHSAPDFMHWVEAEQQTEQGAARRAEYDQLTGAIKAQYGIESPPPIEILGLSTDLTICFIIPQLQPLPELIGKHIRHVGATLLPRPHDGSFPLERLQQQRVVFISLGTVFNEQPKFYKRCIETFGGTDYTVVMAVGTQNMVDMLGELPPNFIVRPFVPQLEVLQHTHVFVTHGGMGSIQEALYYSVPMVICPQMIEQVLNAAQVEKLGAGMNLAGTTEAEGEMVSAERLRESVEQVMKNPEYKRIAEHLGQELRQCSPAYAADVVQAFVHEKVTITGD